MFLSLYFSLPTKNVKTTVTVFVIRTPFVQGYSWDGLQSKTQVCIYLVYNLYARMNDCKMDEVPVCETTYTTPLPPLV